MMNAREPFDGGTNPRRRPAASLGKTSRGTAPRRFLRRKSSRRSSQRATLLSPKRLAVFVLAGLTAVGLIALTVATPRSSHSAVALHKSLDQAASLIGFRLNQIEVKGYKQTDIAAVFAALKQPERKSLPAFDVATARAKLKRLHWVRDAELIRVWPDTLRVQIVERQPFGVWLRPDAGVIFDRSGRLLQQVSASADFGLPVFKGKGAPLHAASLLANIKVHQDLATQLAYAERIGTRRWRLALRSGTRIELPEKFTAASLARFMASSAWPLARNGRVRTVDLRIAGRTILRNARPPRDRKVPQAANQAGVKGRAG